jgi:hemerythrin
METNKAAYEKAVVFVDVDFMNATHLEEVNMVNLLGEYIMVYDKLENPTQEGAKQITQLLESWLHHTSDHYERENTLMREIEFPASSVHMREHEKAYDKMVSVVNAWKETKDIALLKDYVFYLWPAWFEAHVTSMDMMTARFAVMNGFDAQAAEILAT